MSEINPGNLLTIIDAAKVLGVTRAAIHKAWQRGRLAGHVIAGHILIDKASLAEYRLTRRAQGRAGRPRLTRAPRRQTKH